MTGSGVTLSGDVSPPFVRASQPRWLGRGGDTPSTYRPHVRGGQG